jgi:hypothetical protein
MCCGLYVRRTNARKVHDYLGARWISFRQQAERQGVIAFDNARPVPELIAIEHDDYHAEHVGMTVDGRQFFLTDSFDPATGGGAACNFFPHQTSARRIIALTTSGCIRPTGAMYTWPSQL